MQGEARDKARAREKGVGLFEVAVDEQVLPRHQHLVHDEDGVVLVQPRGERIVERTAHRRRHQLVRRAADELHAASIHRDHREDRQLGLAERGRAIKADEIVMGQRRAGRDDLGAADDHAGVGFFFDVREDVGHFVGRFAAVGGRIDNRVIEKQAFLLRLAIPSERVLLIGRVELRVGAQRAGEARLVVGRSADPSVGDLSPTRRSRRARRPGLPRCAGPCRTCA